MAKDKKICPYCDCENFKRIIKPVTDDEVKHHLRRNYYLIDICNNCGADFGVLEYPIKLMPIKYYERL